MPTFSKHLLSWPVLTVAALLAAAPALAQQDQAPAKNNFGPRNTQGQGQGKAQPGQAGPRAQQPAAEVVATHGDWKIQCGQEPKPGADGQTEKQCVMVLTSRSEKNAKVSLTTLFARAKQNGKDVTMMRILAPIGVYLPTGVAMEVDGGAIGRVPFMRCAPQVCVAFGETGDQTLDKFRKGTAANFIIYEAPGIGMPIKISLNGFSAAFAALGKL
ncbi:invasion associated locus B family protein [Taklimakanibacter lacteus]|uniref:invasion associated locus B family protein n=1 Tax=Taklimakanibacter lacteus TaxID=2268456 RepID=UPI000E66E376